MSQLTYTLDDGESPQSKCYRSNVNLSDEYLEECNCPIECETDEYRWVYSFGDVLDPKMRKKIIIEMFYDEMRETVISEEKKTELTDLVATLGGILALFTGFSFLNNK